MPDITVTLNSKTCACGGIFAIPHWVVSYRCPFCAARTITAREDRIVALTDEIAGLRRSNAALRAGRVSGPHEGERTMTLTDEQIAELVDDLDDVKRLAGARQSVESTINAMQTRLRAARSPAPRDAPGGTESEPSGREWLLEDEMRRLKGVLVEAIEGRGRFAQSHGHIHGMRWVAWRDLANALHPFGVHLLAEGRDAPGVTKEMVEAAERAEDEHLARENARKFPGGWSARDAPGETREPCEQCGGQHLDPPGPCCWVNDRSDTRHTVCCPLGASPTRGGDASPSGARPDGEEGAALRPEETP